MTLADFNVKEQTQWCPGCGDFAIVAALKSALAELALNPHEVVIVSGIGCSGKSPHYINTYGFEGLHGRALPVASGVKLANHELTVIAMGGDGDGYGIGAGHYVHIMRRNYDITYIVHNNQIYGLTTGQASPTTYLNMKTKSTPHGVIELPFNPLTFAILGGATFVARAFAGDLLHMKNIMKEAIRHKGFALVDVLQPCVTFNKLNTYEYFQKRCYKLEDEGHDSADLRAALDKAMEEVESGYERLPIGIFYRVERETYEDKLPQLKECPLVKKTLQVDISRFCERLK